MSKTRRTLKWAGVVGCSLIVAAWALNIYRATWLSVPGLSIWLGDDCIDVVGHGYMQDWLRAEYGWLSIDEYIHHDGAVWLRPPRYEGTLHAQDGQVDQAFLLVIPLWLPFLIFVVPTAFLFWRDRRRTPAGHCQNCGYNVMGNVSGRCSECGTEIAN